MHAIMANVATLPDVGWVCCNFVSRAMLTAASESNAKIVFHVLHWQVFARK